jgi:hypothetical protein
MSKLTRSLPGSMFMPYPDDQRQSTLNKAIRDIYLVLKRAIEDLDNARVDTTDDIIIDSSSTGLVLKDAAGTPHYWRVTVDTSGNLQTADLGTTKP